MMPGGISNLGANCMAETTPQNLEELEAMFAVNKQKRANSDASQDSESQYTPDDGHDNLLSDARDTHDSKPRRKHKYDVLKNSKATAFTVVGTAAVLAVFAGIGYTTGFTDALPAIVDIKDEGEVIDKGTASVDSVDFMIQPITLQTNETNTHNFTTKLSKAIKIPGLELNGFGRMMSVDARIGTEIAINPETVTVNYDPTIETLSDRMTIVVPDGALSSRVYVIDGDIKAKDSSTSAEGLPLEIQSVLANAIAGVLGIGASEVILIGDSAATIRDYNNQQTRYTHLMLLKEVNKVCTPLVYEIPGIQSELEQNVKEVIVPRMFNPIGDDTSSMDKLGQLIELRESSYEDFATVVNGSKVIMSTKNISMDQSVTNELKTINEGETWTTDNNEDTTIECGVSKTMDLINVSPHDSLLDSPDTNPVPGGLE
jgi:hypothetical protein